MPEEGSADARKIAAATELDVQIPVDFAVYSGGARR
jgi:hypothetical protein